LKRAIFYLSLAIVFGYLTGLIYDYVPFKTSNEILSYIAVVIEILFILGAIYQLLKQIFKVK